MTNRKQEDLLSDELVDSRALETTSGDRFRHADLVAELTALVCTVPTPANVALFAPWGSGKSGMGNLLATSLESHSGVKFVRFDASKYGEAPLRRHFISQVAKGLGHDDDKYSKDLYRYTEDRDLNFPVKEFVPLIWYFALTLCVVGVLLFGLAALVAAVSSGGFHKNWSPTIKSYLIPALPVAALVTLFVKMAADGLVVKSIRSAPSGDEEFERLFRELVKGTKAKRIVVFVDELDRCSSAEVASTLETIKTFLEVEKCVFIVAADHQVLEQALRKKARQETPVDPTNPYYSAGSSYLDKIFQYQYQLPPLKSRRLTRYALDLVRDRKGIWQRVDDLPEAISVLIPTHTTSPRRVKVLLNSFALTYRLAERRAKEGVLDSHLPARASEIAKLVCLRCEFPLFAEDLSMDPRLPSLVRALADGEEITVPIRPEVRTRAAQYAKGLLPVAELLTDEDRPITSVLATDGPVDAADDQDDENGPADTGTTEVSTVAGEHAQQLVRYLRKVSHIPGPAADLIYLESAGALFGLDPEVADDLESAAMDGDQKLVLELVTPLDENGRRAAIWLLAGLVQDASVGIEGQNVLSTLLGTMSHTSLNLGSIAADVANAVAGHQTQLKLRPEDYCGALILGLASGRGVGRRLRDQVLSSDDALARQDVAGIVLRGAKEIPETFDKALGNAVTTLLVGDDDKALIDAFEKLADKEIQRVLECAEEPITARIPDPLAEDAADEAIAARKATIEMIAKRFDSLVAALVGSKKKVSAAITTTIALDTGEVPIQQAIFKHLAAQAPITDKWLCEALIKTAPIYVISAWANQLSHLDPATVAEISDLGEALSRLPVVLWQRSIRDDPDPDETRAEALAALKRLIDGGVEINQESISNAIHERLSASFVTDDSSDAQDRCLDVARQFIEARVVDQLSVANSDLAGCTATLSSPNPPEQQPQATHVPDALYRRITTASRSASIEALDSVAAAIPASQWLTQDLRDALLIVVAACRRRVEPTTTAPFDTDTLAAISQRGGEVSDYAIAEWLRAFQPPPDEVWTVLGGLTDDPLPRNITTALTDAAASKSAKEKFDLARPALEDLSRTPNPAYLRAIRFSESDQVQSATAIMKRAHGSDAGAQEIALALWSQLAPTGQATQEKLISQLYIPTIQSGPSGVNLAISQFGIVSHQRSKVRDQIMNALYEHAADDDQRKRIDERLRDARWLKRGGLLGLGALTKADDRESD